MSFTQHVSEEKYKVVLSSLTAAVGFLIALLINSSVERYRDAQTYNLMRHAIKVEADSNAQVLKTGFLKNYKGGVVFQQFNTAATTQFLSSPSFLKYSSPAEIALLSVYVRDLALANKYREKHEWLTFEENYQNWLPAVEDVWKVNLEQCEKSISAVSALEAS